MKYTITIVPNLFINAITATALKTSKINPIQTVIIMITVQEIKICLENQKVDLRYLTIQY